MQDITDNRESKISILQQEAKLFWIENDLNKRLFIRNLTSVYPLKYFKFM